MQRATKCHRVVNAFADERTFAEKILIHIGHRTAVRIDAGFTGKQPREPRFPCTGQIDRGAWLQNRIAVSDASISGKTCTIQRMRQSSNQFARGVARQLRVGVKRDDKAILRKTFAFAGNDTEA